MELFIPEEIKTISKTLNNSGYQCYLVGGAIRNQLLGKEAKDFDLTTDAKPETVIKLFRRVIPTGLKHGTVTILIGDNGFEITTYRIDGKYSDGRRPDKIQFTPSIEEDLLRRDFTINSLALNIQTEEILDINNGIYDLNKKTIRAIGKPSKRFDEDALRLVRACRFASQLNFTIESETYQAMSTTLGKLGAVSKERIAEELIKILKSPHPSIAFTHFYNCGMLEILFPELYSLARKDFPLFKESITDCDKIEDDNAFIRFARVLSIVKKEDQECVLKNLKLSNNFIKKTLNLLSFIDSDLNKLKEPYQARLLTSQIGVNSVEDLLKLWSGMKRVDPIQLNRAKETIREQIKNNSPFTIKDLDIDGKLLQNELNLKPGPIVGDILKKCLNYVLEDPKRNKKETLLGEIKRTL